MPADVVSRRWDYSELGKAVSGTVAELQRGYLSDAKQPWATTALARLRQATNRAPGSVPNVWDQTIGIVPAHLQGGSDEPSAHEWAAHIAITFFALHQQGRLSDRMAQSGGSLGSAARRLVTDPDLEDSIRRRFQAVALAETRQGVAHHLRALIGLLRGAGVPLDYGRLADDLVDMFSGRDDGVRLRWGRDFRRIDKTPDLSDPDSKE
ncbi:type I-E CRISPR-associated protein Cse2/CasB [Williamsia sp. CHRR-6]|uniref:type I-E CRISPR-associated protein Cse2/CasB n=1 Tax=Williamsia sp. CHRR-6 TaxID=2835871 RepID=UPI001BDA03F3|nr:type I-E CRISPR-associated protein Cse2/CasB [Williamsia sp. CHRR-6]MBT0566994.1 type I-E CRISPR-associated protein Cse2/CasB [Williamsia sp. CHRR-6]